MHLLIDGQALQTASSRYRGIGRFGRNLLRALVIARPSCASKMVQNSAVAPLAADDRNGLPVLSFHPPLPLHRDNHEVNERFYADWLTARARMACCFSVLSRVGRPSCRRFVGRGRACSASSMTSFPCCMPNTTSASLTRRTGTLFAFANFCKAMPCWPTPRRRRGTFDAWAAARRHSSSTLAARSILCSLRCRRTTSLPVAGRSASVSVCTAISFSTSALWILINLHGVLHAFAALSPDHRAALDLAVVCRMKPAERAFVETAALEAGVASSLRLICSADDEELRALYQMCRLFFFPSLYEGLGLPVLEALHCGAPVVTSNCSSLPEYAGPHSWLTDPASPQEMAKVLQQALAEPRDARRAEREAFARSFSWPRSAERACAIMERITTRQRRSVRRRRRLAWVMPLTKDARGMVEYAAELLPRLAKRFDIELIAGSGSLEIPESLSSRHHLLTAQEVPARHAASPYDMFLYHMSLPKHEKMLDLLEQFPGLVVLHNFSPTDIRCLAECKMLSCLGVLVHTPEAWQQIRHTLDVPAIHLAKSMSPSTTELDERVRFAAAYTAWVDLAIARFEQSDGLWRGFALQSLQSCSEPPRNIINSWAMLRARAQQLAGEHSAGLAASAPPSAA